MDSSQLNPAQKEIISGLARPLLELYGFKRIGAVTKRIVDSVELKPLAEHGFDGLAGPRKITLDPMSFWSPHSSATIGLVLHEIAHQRRLGKVDPAMANAFSYYFDVLDRLWEHNSALISLVNLSANKEFITDLEGALKRQNYLAVLKTLTEKYPGLSKHKFAHMLEHEGSEYHKSYNQIGFDLANLAIVVEVQKKKPGIGLFLIRDLSTGVSAEKSLQKIFRGDYERMRKSLIRRYPHLREGIMQRMYYSKGLHTGVRRRAAQLKKWHPDRVRESAHLSPRRK